ncbi:hypothetical protein BGZ74_008781 [Mortierella antarctica]|nr:hypothetical protein BGZ74_008781 [Mortierella antarctica]KAG0355617.1 hypothetical protein BG005_005443 [Podila minutissima]
MASEQSNASQDTSSQFWIDFWDTLYQFTHPFSSTFFDSLFDSKDDATTSTEQQQQPPSPPSSSSSQDAMHFPDKASFEKFWKGLQHGQYHHDTHPTTLADHVLAIWTDVKAASLGFLEAVDWQQTWIQMILTLHVLVFVTIILLRNRPNALAGMLFCTILLAAMSEPLNGVGNRHWKLFSDDNYFDTHGVFTSLVWATPLLGNALLAVLFLLRSTLQMLVKVKRAQLQETRKKKQK